MFAILLSDIYSHEAREVELLVVAFSSKSSASCVKFLIFVVALQVFEADTSFFKKK